MKSFFTFLLVIVFTIQLSAQKRKFLSTLKDQKTFDLAQDLYDEGKFEFAMKQFKKLEMDFPTEPIILYRIGVCHLYEKGNREIAHEYLSKVDKSKFSKSDFLYRLAQAQALVGKYDEAKLNATEALTKKLDPKKLQDVALLLKQIEIAKATSNNPAYTVSNAGNTINTKFDETQPAINAAGNYLLYAYSGEKSFGGLQAQPGDKNADGVFYTDIYLSKKGADGSWSNAKIYDSLLATNGSEYPLSIAADEKRMLSGKQESYTNYSISVNKKDSASWVLFGELSGLINTNGYEGGAALFPSNTKIIFSSDRLGGFGGKDLYIAELMEDSTWGKVKNLGQGINSPYDEDFPHMHIDGKTLHFSSNGPQSMGGYDIFTTEYSPEEDTWGSKTNLGAPINTTHDELQFQVLANGKMAYFSSGRPGGLGGSDIYMVNGLSYKSDPEFEKREAEKLAAMQKRVDDSIAVVKAKEIEAQQAALAKSQTIDNAKTTTNSNNALSAQKAAKEEARLAAIAKANEEKVAKMEAKRMAAENAKAEKEAKRAEMIAKQEASKLAKEEALAEKKANAGTSNDVNNAVIWDWSKYDLSSESAIAAEFGDINVNSLVYKVQIASGTLPESITNTINADLGQIEEIKVKGGRKYVIEKSFGTINEAFQLKNKAIDKGISDAFITGFYNGKRIYLIDLVKKGILRK
jgi:WD40-like Beta Propeller Repeat